MTRLTVLRGHDHVRARHHPRLEGVVHRVEATGPELLMRPFDVIDNLNKYFYDAEIIFILFAGENQEADLLNDSPVIFSVVQHGNGHYQLCSLQLGGHKIQTLCCRIFIEHCTALSAPAPWC